MAIETACVESQETRILALLNQTTRDKHDL